MPWCDCYEPDLQFYREDVTYTVTYLETSPGYYQNTYSGGLIGTVFLAETSQPRGSESSSISQQRSCSIPSPAMGASPRNLFAPPTQTKTIDSLRIPSLLLLAIYLPQ